MNLTDIKWDVFTIEERSMIEGLVSKGHYSEITHAVMMDSFEKEYWVTKILSQVKPESIIVDSEVAKELMQEKVKGNEIETPEKEAEWQAKLDDEKKNSKTKLSKRAKEELEKETKNLETAITKKSKKDIK